MSVLFDKDSSPLMALEENHVEEVKADLGLEAVEDEGDEEAAEGSEDKIENVRISSIMYYRKKKKKKKDIKYRGMRSYRNQERKITLHT